jgi:DNA-binding NarL/FixJ family response regulator
MPVKDGLNAVREISQLAPQIPILLYTMHKSAQLELEAQKSGIRKVLSKSDSGQLIASIQQLPSSTAPASVASTPVASLGEGPLSAVAATPQAVAISASSSMQIQPTEPAAPTASVTPKDVT